MRLRYVEAPHPHLLVEEILPAVDYARLRFPDTLVAPGAAWGITATDDNYAEVMRDPAWRALRDAWCSADFVHEVLGYFAAEMRRVGCRVDPARVRLGDFVETREQKEQRQLALDGDPDELFTRLDFQSKALGAYREFVHLDWARRLVGGILFFSDAAAEGLVGGELALYRDRGFRDDRWCHDPELSALFAPRANTGVVFLNSNAGFHGPRAISALRGRRRWLYYTISSRLDVWPCEPRAVAQ
jgi:hypothetical protein